MIEMTGKTVVGQKCVIYDAVQGKVLLLQRSDYKRNSVRQDRIDSFSWDMTGGKVEVGQNAKTAITTEIKEETGIIAHYAMPIDFHSRIVDNGDFFVFTLWWCHDYTIPDGRIVLSHEHLAYEWVALAAIEKYRLRESIRYVLPEMSAYEASFVSSL